MKNRPQFLSPFLFGCAVLLSLPAPAQPPAPNVTEAPIVRIDGQEMRSLGFNLLSAFKYTIFDAGSGAKPE